MANVINIVGLGPILLDSFYRGSVNVDRKVQISALEEVNFHPPEGEPISTSKEILVEPGGPTFWAVNTIRSLSGGKINPKMIATIGGHANDP